MLMVVRKDYAYVKGNLGKIKAAIADIGWLLTQKIYSQSMGRKVTQSLTVNDFESGQYFLRHFLEDAGNCTWFKDIEQRVADYGSPIGTLRSACTSLSNPHLLFEENIHLQHRDLCIEVSLLCTFLEDHIRKEVEETQQPLLRLL